MTLEHDSLISFEELKEYSQYVRVGIEGARLEISIQGLSNECGT